MLVLAVGSAGAGPEPAVFAGLHRLEEVLADDGGGVGLGLLRAVLLGDDGLELGLIPKLHGVRLVRLIVVVDVPLGGARASLAGLLADVEIVGELALLGSFGAAAVAEVFAEDRLRVDALRDLLLLDADPLGAQEELLGLLRRLPGGPRGGLAKLGGRVVHVLEPLLRHLLLLEEALLAAEVDVLVRELLLLADLLGLLLLDRIVAHALLLRLEAVLLRGRLPHGD